jgi:hypothetical protein
MILRVTVSTSSLTTDYDFAGLGVDQSETRSYTRPCEETRQAHADSLNQVGESDESNNVVNFANAFC